MMHEQIVQQLRDKEAQFVIHEHVEARTVTEAVENLPFPLERFLKTVAFRLKKGGWVLAAVRGADRVDYRKLAAACGVKRDELVRASPEEVQQTLGIEAGSVGPVPTIEGMQVIFDTQVSADVTLYCGVGRIDRTLEISLPELLRLTGGRVLPIVQESSG